MGLNRRRHLYNGMHGTPGVNLAHSEFDEVNGQINQRVYRFNYYGHQTTREELKIEQSRDDDEFHASFWRRYYKMDSITWRRRRAARSGQ